MPRGRKQAQEIYVPRGRRAETTPDKKDDGSASSGDNKEIKKQNTAREPPQKRRLVEGEKDRRRSREQGVKGESKRRDGEASELKHKSEKSFDARDEERKASSSRSERSRKIERTTDDNDADLFQRTKSGEGYQDMLPSTETMSSHSVYPPAKEQLPCDVNHQDVNITSGAISEQVSLSHQNEFQHEDSLATERIQDAGDELSSMPSVRSMECATQHGNPVHARDCESKVDPMPTDTMQQDGATDLPADTTKDQRGSECLPSQERLDVFDKVESADISGNGTDTIVVQDDVTDMESSNIVPPQEVNQSTQEDDISEDAQLDNNQDVAIGAPPGRTMESSVSKEDVPKDQLPLTEEAETMELSVSTNEDVPKEIYELCQTEEAQNDVDVMREEMEPLNSSQEKEGGEGEDSVEEVEEFVEEGGAECGVVFKQEEGAQSDADKMREEAESLNSSQKKEGEVEEGGTDCRDVGNGKQEEEGIVNTEGVSNVVDDEEIEGDYKIVVDVERASSASDNPCSSQPQDTSAAAVTKLDAGTLNVRSAEDVKSSANENDEHIAVGSVLPQDASAAGTNVDTGTGDSKSMEDNSSANIVEERSAVDPPDSDTLVKDDLSANMDEEHIAVGPPDSDTLIEASEDSLSDEVLKETSELESSHGAPRTTESDSLVNSVDQTEQGKLLQNVIDDIESVKPEREGDSTSSDSSQESSDDDAVGRQGDGEASSERARKVKEDDDVAMETTEQGEAGDGDDNDEMDEDSWDALFDESGQCLKPEEEEEVSGSQWKIINFWTFCF